MKRIMRLMVACFCCLNCFSCLTSCQKEGERGIRYEINVEYSPENRTIAGSLKLTFCNQTDNALSLLKFQLYPNAYRQGALYKPVSSTYQNAAYYQGESYGEMVISSVNGCKNWEIEGEDENILCVYLERALYPGETLVLDVGFITKLATVAHRTGIAEKTVSFGNFFPILCGIKNGGFVENLYYAMGNPFYSECADYKISLTLPKEYVVVSSGSFLEESVLESKKAYTMSAANTRDFAMVISKDYEVARVEEDGTVLSYYYFEDETPLKTLEIIEESFCFYEEKFGDYPYESYSVAEAGLCLDGVDYPRLSILSNRLDGEGRTRAIVYETARQWWYAVVGSDQIENAWQSEGLAAYSSLLFFEEYEKYGITREGLLKEGLKEYRSYYDVYGSVLGRTDTRMTRHLSEFVNEYEYSCIARDKALIMFETLRKSVGDGKFSTSLKRYYADNRFRVALTGDLVGSFERTGLDVAGFFESFLSGKAIL